LATKKITYITDPTSFSNEALPDAFEKELVALTGNQQLIPENLKGHRSISHAVLSE